MCGIFAYIFGIRPKLTTEQIKSSFETLRPRGPDCSKEYWTEQYMLGFQRLAIVDPTPEGDQPMILGDYALVCNGEIYNHLQLKESCQFEYKSHSDCAVIPPLIQKFGMTPATIQTLKGVFAFVLAEKDRVHAVRDRIGVRPLFYGWTEDHELIFASEAKALMTCVTIYPLPPGTIHTFDLTGKLIGVQLYFSLPKVHRQLSTKETLNVFADVRTQLTLAVRRRLMADRPLACLLSGGLDSSIVAYLLSQELGHPVHTYSIGMKDSVDLKYARLVANYLKTKHTEVTFTAEDGLAIIPEVIRTIESYDITTVRASVGMYLIAKYISTYSEDKVIFSGEGSDEVFCGYLYFHLAPDNDQLFEESRRLVYNLYKYDVLRADRCISAHGLELRVPFLDSDLIKFVMELDGAIRAPKVYQEKRIEKYLLREAFQGCLPKKVLWRRKDGFSDAVAGVSKPWYAYIQEYVETKVSDKGDFPSKEARWYWEIYHQYYPKFKAIDSYWMPKWTDTPDPSGRLVEGIYDEDD